VNVRLIAKASAVVSSAAILTGSIVLSSPLASASVAHYTAQERISDDEGSPSSAQIVAIFNKERARNGLGKVTLNADWSRKCALHNKWMKLNKQISHYEVPGSRGYSAGGEWAGKNSVLAGTSWRDGDPFRLAPIHLSQLMSPDLKQVGAAEGYGYSCMTTWPGYTNTPKVGFSWFPGQGATVAPNEKAFESPTVPQTWVGIKAGVTTGPHLYVYYAGRPGEQANVTSAKLVGPDGPVKVSVVTEQIAGLHGYGGYLPTLAILIPRKPLPASADFTATVVASGKTTKLSFHTGAHQSANRNQLIKFSPRSLLVGQSRKLPSATNRGVAITWKNLSKSPCKIDKKLRLRATRPGQCAIQAEARSTVYLSGVKVMYRMAVTRS